ncbi:glycosyltransferase [Mucilaginibacter boryungensis]|uniref:Glycosyltransferase family 2 protein n=1 Tax=Mucilaginibacter boryungensis TaxID=768480 RepID=A0ABR9XM85_9SPHI|nr:glycosyltransferase [Mucilaginibacter boryungensis]MBE9668498.1 glycosyltransferase family 2 protein [Mucilaginibacter boryungensis]
MFIVLSAIFFFIILRFVVSLFNFLSDPKLRRVVKPYHHLVSILIPARNEEANIIRLLQSIRQQDYQDYEVIVLDDNSTDNTYHLCREFAGNHSKFSIIRGNPLPPDWLGKNYACFQLAKQAKGKLLLFLDADTIIEPGLINSALHRMYVKKLGLLSLFPNQQIQRFGEHLVVPLVHYILLNLLPLQLVYLLRNRMFSAASGQFMLFDAAIYHQHQWHHEVRHKVVEDVEIMRLVKSAGYNAETLLANNLISSRMYHSYREAINGFSKNILAAFNYNVFSLLIFLIILLGGPLIVITTLNLNLIAMLCGLIALNRIMISLTAGQSPWKNVLLHPVQMLSLMVIAFLAIQRYLTRTTVWKGRKV